MSAMWTTISAVVVLVLAASPAQSRANVGCLLSKQVCEQDEWCYDDFAFGHCMASADRLSLHDLHRYELETDALKQLEREFRRLFTAGYRWTHGYTQCIVKLMLRSFRHKKQFDRKKCEENQDEDLERALKFLEAQDEIDPKDVALIKFEPSAMDPESEFGDELFIPSKDMYSHLIKAGKDDKSLGHVKPHGGSGKRKKKQGGPEESSDKIIDLNRRLTQEEFYQLLDAISVADEDDQFPEVIDYPLQSDEVLDPEGKSWSFSKRQGKYDDLTAASQLGSNFEEKNEGEEEEDELNNDEDLYYVTNSPILDSSYIFDRSHRYDVKKPGPFFKVNNYIFEKEERRDKMNEDREPRIFQYHPLFEESDVSENSFRRHHQKQPLAELTADGMDHTNYYQNSADKNDSEQSLDALKRYGTNRRDDFDESPPYFRDANNDEISIEDNIVNEILLANSNGDEMEFDRNGDSQDLRNTFPWNINRKSKSKEMSDVLPSQNSQKSLNRWLKNDYSRHVKYHQEPGAVNHAVVVEKNSIKHNNNSEAKSGVGETEKRIFSDKQNDVLFMEPPDAHLKEARASLASPAENNFEIVDASYAYMIVNKEFTDLKDGKNYAKKLETLLHLPPGTFSNIKQEGNQITFKVNSNSNGMSASDVAGKAENVKDELQKISGKMLKSSGIGNKIRLTVHELNSGSQVIIITFIVCGVIAGLVLGVGVLYLIMHHSRSKKKLQGLTQAETEASQDYQELCRQRMAIKSSEKPEPIQVLAAQRISGLSKESETSVHSPSSRSSTSSWNEEPVVLNMDISTGHMVLSYMEDHLTNKDRLDKEWEALCRYEADPATFTIANQSNNFQNNRYPNILPYDHSRVILNEFCNASGFDYINANTITDHDPRNAAYIATQGPLPHTSADFWQMVWEQGSVVIVMLTRLVENGVAMCHRYWPEEGSELYHIYEVHLVSEHIWCEDYLIRNFYLKNLKTGETRTVTQFHFLSWPDAGVPVSAKMILDFRRKVNKSYRGRSCPIVIHCSDGCGRTGTYCLIDMVLNRMAKGLKEIDIAATLEHIRDQRIGMVQNKEQFQFVLMAVAEEVHSILKTIP